MSDPRRGPMSSAFDDLLARNWQQFEELGGPPRRYGTAAPTGGRGDAAPAPGGEGDVTPAVDAGSADGWRHEVVDSRRAGDEAVVTCRLIDEETGRETVQQGRAPLGAGRRLAGRSGGIAFSIGVAGDDEAAAFEAATAAALAACRAQF